MIFFHFFSGDNFLKIIDIFSGQTIRFPDSKSVVKYVGYVKIYAYVEAKGFTDEAYYQASLVFSRRKASIYRIVEKIKKLVGKEDIDEGDSDLEH